jgi:hypothetical protein
LKDDRPNQNTPNKFSYLVIKQNSKKKVILNEILDHISKQTIIMSNKKILMYGLLFTAGVAVFLFWPGNSASNMLSNNTEVVMYKNEGCQCCTKWGDHMQEGEFAVEEVPVPVLMQVKRDNGITRELASCHTAIVDGYVVEGHVPREDVERLLSERPDAIGLAVPGMPTGSPGMEIPGRAPDSYDVLLVNKDGSTSVFASH